MSSPGRVAMEALMATQNATNNTEVAWEAAAQAVIDHHLGPDRVVVSRYAAKNAANALDPLRWSSSIAAIRKALS